MHGRSRKRPRPAATDASGVAVPSHPIAMSPTSCASSVSVSDAVPSPPHAAQLQPASAPLGVLACDAGGYRDRASGETVHAAPGVPADVSHRNGDTATARQPHGDTRTRRRQRRKPTAMRFKDQWAIGVRCRRSPQVIMARLLRAMSAIGMRWERRSELQANGTVQSRGTTLVKVAVVVTHVPRREHAYVVSASRIQGGSLVFNRVCAQLLMQLQTGNSRRVTVAQHHSMSPCRRSRQTGATFPAPSVRPLEPPAAVPPRGTRAGGLAGVPVAPLYAAHAGIPRESQPQDDDHMMAATSTDVASPPPMPPPPPQVAAQQRNDTNAAGRGAAGVTGVKRRAVQPPAPPSLGRGENSRARVLSDDSGDAAAPALPVVGLAPIPMLPHAPHRVIAVSCTGPPHGGMLIVRGRALLPRRRNRQQEASDDHAER